MRTRKTIFWASLVFIILCIVVPYVAQDTPLEFSNDRIQSMFITIRGFGLPFAILLTLNGTLKPKNSTIIKGIKIALTIFVSMLTFWVLAMIEFGDPCGWKTDKILFYNINDKNVNIVSRDFGCLRDGTGMPTIEVYRMKKITPLFLWVTNIDTTKIDRQIWKRMEEW